MIIIKTNELCICIPDQNPNDRIRRIIKALAAAVRWRASYRELYREDDENLTELSQLMEELSREE